MLKQILLIIVDIILLLIIFYQVYFLRKPERHIPKGTIVSPADGRIARIIEIGGKSITIEKGLLGKIKTQTRDTIKKGYLINIVLTPLNVHYQRAPCDGTVLSVKHFDGAFKNAVIGAKTMPTLHNERTEILIKSSFGKIKVIQIAGFLARRIETIVKKNDKIKKGQIIGIIKLGSQVSLIIPKCKLKVREGQRVVDGETVIAQ